MRHECPLCGRRQRQFANYQARKGAVCRRCGAFERHRKIWAWMVASGEAVKLADARVLDVAPQPGLSSALAQRAHSYVSVDLRPGNAMKVADLCNLVGFADGALDLIVCSHVLEHVPDDGQAMREMLRVLAPGGAAILSAPLRGPVTIEDLQCSEQERLRRFGQVDHVRRYGWDIIDRLSAAGFTPDPVDVRDVLSPKQIDRYGIAVALPWVVAESKEPWLVLVGRKP